MLLNCQINTNTFLKKFASYKILRKGIEILNYFKLSISSNNVCGFVVLILGFYYHQLTLKQHFLISIALRSCIDCLIRGFNIYGTTDQFSKSFFYYKIFFQAFLLSKTYTFIHEENNLHFCSYVIGKGGWGLRAFADMSAKNFFGRLP